MSQGFFKDEEVRNKAADEPWKKSERDYVLDQYLAGGNDAHPNVLARKLGRNPKAVKRLLEQFTYNERDRVVVYEPFRRRSRKGLRWTQNELSLVKAHREKGVPLKETAKLLMRDLEELSGEVAGEVAKTKRLREVAPTLDLIWAHRYIHFVYKTPIISDKAYDALVEEEIEYGGAAEAFEQIKKHSGWPQHIKSLAIYLIERTKYDENLAGN